MIDLLLQIFKPGVKDIIDILFVTFIIYNVFIILQRTKASSMLLGLIFIIILSIISSFLQLNALTWLISAFKTVWLLGFIVIFQPELRRILANIGSNRFLSFLSTSEREEIFDELINAVEEMSRKKTGALIIITQTSDFKDILESGTQFIADINSKLIQTIFFKNSPLHDGALIIKGNYIIAASCILPLTELYEVSSVLGTRHRAALGITEHTDAIAIVVSEETGTISVAKNGVLSRNLTGNALKNKIEEYLSINKKPTGGSNEKKDFWHNFTNIFKHD